MVNFFKIILRSNLLTYKFSLRLYGFIKSVSIKFLSNEISISKDSKKIYINIYNISYTKELIDYFDFYFDSVEGVQKNELKFFPDSSFRLKNFRYKEKLFFPSVPTPSNTSKAYLDIFRPESGDIVIDLGSYAGVTVIDYLLTVGIRGYVLGVEADPKNFKFLQKNLNQFSKSHPDYKFDLENSAITNHDKGVLFSSNSDMSSAVHKISPILYQNKKNLVKVKSLKLSQLITKYELNKVDLIKADIEGSELDALNDEDFFNEFSPKILLEPISMKGKNSLSEIVLLLKKFHYNYKIFDQDGAGSPIVMFYR